METHAGQISGLLQSLAPRVLAPRGTVVRVHGDDRELPSTQRVEWVSRLAATQDPDIAHTSAAPDAAANARLVAVNSAIASDAFTRLAVRLYAFGRPVITISRNKVTGAK